VRANFIRHIRRFFSDSAGSAPRERAQPTKGEEEKETERGADYICTAVSHVAPAKPGGAACGDFVRPVIIGELLLFYGRPHARSVRLSRTAIRPG